MMKVASVSLEAESPRASCGLMPGQLPESAGTGSPAAGLSVRDLVWTVPTFRWRIVCPALLLDELRQHALEGLRRVPRRGLEVGGILLGRRTASEIHLQAWRPIYCEHAYGPGFRLSERDFERLEADLQHYTTDPELAGLEVVGWFRSHTRDGVCLTAEDLELYQRCFPEPWQVALVIRPHLYEPARAGFFFRETDGTIRSDKSYQEFILEPVRRRFPIGFDPAQIGERAGWEKATGPEREWFPELERPRVAEPSPAAPLPEPPVPAVGAPSWEKPKSRAGRLGNWATAVAIVAVGILLVIWFATPAGDWSSAPSAGLRVRDVEGQLVLEWNPSSPVVRQATEARLTIQDGPVERNLKLSPAELRSGSLTYLRSGQEVEFRVVFVLDGGRQVPEVTRFVGPPVNWAGASGVANPQGAEVQGLAAEAERLREQLRQAVARTEALRAELERLRATPGR